LTLACPFVSISKFLFIQKWIVNQYFIQLGTKNDFNTIPFLPEQTYLRLPPGVGLNGFRRDFESTMSTDCRFRKLREGTSLSSSAVATVREKFSKCLKALFKIK